jgi:DNA phosphorothioation-dependent restriction protein DptH
MKILATSRIIGGLVEKYYRFAKSGNQDCRLLVPGLTPNIARQLHAYLLQQSINSFLIVGDDEQPNEADRFIRAVGLTSKRIGSFVAIASPGQLVHVQDSIRGSGGTIRSLAFSEEWPWIDSGSESFRFDGPALDAFVKEWSSNSIEQKWLREFTIDGLLEHTRSSSRRAQIFLENILGRFSPTTYPTIPDIIQKFLFHSGIPRPSDSTPPVSKIIKDTTRLCRRVIERCQKDENARDQSRDMIIEVVPVSERSIVRQSLDRFLDGLGRTATLDLGLLAFHGCWGQAPTDHSNWNCLHADRLAELFGIRDRENAEIRRMEVRCQRGFKEATGINSKLATFVEELVEIEVDYRIPVDQFALSPWVVRILNRQQVVVEQVLIKHEGQIGLQFDTNNSGRYAHKIPLRIALISGNDVRTYAKLDLHLCGQDRPAFALIEPGFEVVDATTNDVEETPDKKINIDNPVHVYLFSHNEKYVTLRNDDNEDLGLKETEMPYIWRSAQRIDVTGNPSGQEIVVCQFGPLSAVICFEANDLEKGEFTIEDELRVLLTGPREKRISDLVSLFEGRSRDPYPALGGIVDSARRRISLAKFVSSPTGWRPLLTNLIAIDDHISGSLGDFVNYLGNVEEDALATVKLSPEALSLLRAYSEAREVCLREVGSGLDTSGRSNEHPIYASHPIFVHDRSTQMETLLSTYLETYDNILAYLQSSKSYLEWRQLFVLTHLDCIIHWDSTRLRNTFFLLGPWHPLVFAKRFMVQAALFNRAVRLLREPDGKSFRHLSVLLAHVQGFRWITGLSADDRQIEPSFVVITSDPGWHVAFKTSRPEGVDLLGILNNLQRNLGLMIEMGTGGTQNLTVTALSSYMRAFPSRRSVGARVPRGYSAGDVVRNVDAYLHGEVGPTEHGEQLPGGVRLYLEESLESEVEAQWSNPPLSIYTFDDDKECIQKSHPDIYMLPPTKDVAFKSSTENHILPRGFDREVVFSEPLRWLTEGQKLVPQSITYEFDTTYASAAGIGGAFLKVIGKITELIGTPLTTVASAGLPQHLSAPWVIIPGQSIDPAMLVKYVRDGADRSIQDRALWDYKLDLAGQANSFFILSTIPRGFQVAVSGFFGGKHIAGGFVIELGRIGIAIGGEAMKSGRHALGIIGLVGAVRLLVAETSDGHAPLKCSQGVVSFLVPVDSFASFFGKTAANDGRRTDLLAICIVLHGNGAGNIHISACGVESKFVSGTLGNTRAHDALKQGIATVGEFKNLVLTSLGIGAMPERLALLEFLRFGLRITSPSNPGEIEKWVDTERTIYQAILAGHYEYVDARYNAVLVSTEGGFPGAAEHHILPEGVWARLTKSHWPGVADTPQIQSIRNVLRSMFVIRDVSQPYNPSSGQSVPLSKNIDEPSDIKPFTKELEAPIEQELTKAVMKVSISEPLELPKNIPLEGIFIGVDESRRMVYFDPQSPVDPLDNMNLMVSGSSGTGKTQFLKYLIYKLREQGKNVLVLDMKNDFASDRFFCQIAALERVFVNFDGLPFNPLIPYPVRHPATGDLFIQCAQYIAGVSSVLKQTYGLGVQQQAAVKKAIVAVFNFAGIPTSGSTPYTDGLMFPDFSNVGELLQNDSPSAYNRLDPLFTLGLFREEFRGQSFHALVNQATVLDLSLIPSDQIKNALAQLIVLSAHAYYNTQPHSGKIRQFIVFDEGHRVLNSDYILRLVRECRAYGVGMIISSQYPSDFPSEISASMATKVLHGNGRDIDRVKSVVQMIGCEGREGDIANLGRFQAFIDNRHNPHTQLRTMNYPLYLVWNKLLELGTATRADLAVAEGIDTSKLPIGNLIHQLESLGLAEEKDGKITVIRRI